jgi:hypothetical protein
MVTDNAYICPEMKCGQVVEVDKGYTGIDLGCYGGGCQTTWCRNCLISPFHNGKSCVEVEAENNNTENGKYIWQMKNQGKLKFCPRCKAPSIKYNGCNKMVCGACHVRWCWLCKEIGIGYEHFNSERVGKCNGKLWEGNELPVNELPPLPVPHIHLPPHINPLNHLLPPPPRQDVNINQPLGWVNIRQY